jgi:tape measure domain-containing protein
MSSVDDRIVNMQFNNKQFTQGVTDSQKSLEGLERSLQQTASGQGLNEMGKNVDGIAGKFSALKVAGITAIATVASKATTAGLSLVKSMTIDPIMDGFREYQTNLNSIQTIMANTGEKVNTVNKYLEELNHYSDQTIYNFSQMAQSIGRFTAAGVKLPQATVAIKGMANAAALSGADANQLNSAMYQMSQALASGTIKLMDWNSLVNANMGGKNIQQALMSTAKSMGPVGDAMDAAIKKNGTFRDSLTEGWLTADVFTKTMKVMAGQTDKATGATTAFTEKQLISMGYTADQAKELHRLSQASIDAATKIKTFPQMMDVVKESIGSGFAKIFQDLMGNFNESVNLWTTVGTKITGVVGSIFGALDKALLGWRELGGYQALWAGFGNIFQALGNILRPFIEAFKAVLPSTGAAGQGLANVTKGFEAVTYGIEVATRGLDVLTPVLKVVFTLFKIGADAVGALVKGLAPLGSMFDRAAGPAQGLADKMSSIGDSIISGILKGFNPAAIQAAVTQFAENIVTWIKGALGIASPAAELVPVGFSIAEGIAKGIIEGAKIIGQAIGKVVAGIGQLFTDLFGGMDAMDISALMNALFAGGLILTIRNFTKGLKDSFLGIGTAIQDTFGQLTATLKTMQQSIKAKIIRDIAIAVGILTIAVIALTYVDPKKLAKSLGAIGIMLGELMAALYGLGKVQSEINMAVLAASIFLISLAMVNLATAVIIFGKQDLGTLAKGMGAMALSLGILLGAMYGFSKIKGSIEGMAASMLIISIAMNLLAAAVLAFGLMDMKTLAKGLGAMAVGLGLMVGAMLGMDMMKGSVEGLAASIFVVAAAMVVLAVAVGMLGTMDMSTLAKGLGAIAIGLVLMVAALLVLSPMAAQVALVASALLTLSAAMVLMAVAVGMFGSMDMGTLAKGFAAVAVGLILILAAAAVAEYVAPGLIVLGVAFQLLGQAMLLAGLGMLAFGTGFAILAVTGTAGIAVMTAAIESFIALLPTIAQQLAAAFVAFFQVLANASGKLRESFGTIFRNILGVIKDSIPQIGGVLQQLISTGIGILRKSIPQWVEMGWTVIDQFLKSAAKHVPSIAESALTLIRKFIDVIAANIGPIADSAANLIVKFVQGIADAINNHADDLRSAGLDLAMAIVNGMTGGLLGAGVGMVENAVSSLMSHVPSAAKKLLGIGSPSKVMIPIGFSISQGVAVGIGKAAILAVAAVTDMANAIVAEGDKQTKIAERAASKQQHKAYQAQTRADLKADAARAKSLDAKAAQRYAQKHKKDKQAQKRAKAADRVAKKYQKAADAEQKQADAAQKRAGAAKEHAAAVKRFQQADLHEKGDIRNQQAVALADRASKSLAQAEIEAQRARELRKTDRAASKKMMKEARKDAAAAKKLSNQAKAAHKSANKYYEDEVDARIKQMEDDAAADEKAAADKAKYEAADAQGKSDILTKRAIANERRAAEQKALAEKLMKDAKKIADTDAATAMKYLDQADKASQEAKDAADQAAQERQQALEVLNQGGGSATGAGATIQPGRTVLEDAARAVDRYTASLQQATEMAAAQQGPVQFTQNNYSPASLSASEIYRQSRNLLSAAEIKMGLTAATPL